MRTKDVGVVLGWSVVYLLFSAVLAGCIGSALPELKPVATMAPAAIAQVQATTIAAYPAWNPKTDAAPFMGETDSFKLVHAGDIITVHSIIRHRDFTLRIDTLTEAGITVSGYDVLFRGNGTNKVWVFDASESTCPSACVLSIAFVGRIPDGRYAVQTLPDEGTFEIGE
jgi:hypothetical protein